MYCFRFDSQEQFRSLAAAEGLVTEDGDLITASHSHALDEIGLIHEGGTYDAETGEVITPPTPLPGWHVNFLGAPPESFAPWGIVVNSAVRIFAGGPSQSQPVS
jgi:hypothetical protein